MNDDDLIVKDNELLDKMEKVLEEGGSEITKKNEEKYVKND